MSCMSSILTMHTPIKKSLQRYFIWIAAYASPPDPKVVKWHDTNTMFADSKVLDNIRRSTAEYAEDNETDSVSTIPGKEHSIMFRS